jgi:hypothetical protein
MIIFYLINDRVSDVKCENDDVSFVKIARKQRPREGKKSADFGKCCEVPL